jgi:hypothetical protein
MSADRRIRASSIFCFSFTSELPAFTVKRRGGVLDRGEVAQAIHEIKR